MSKKVDGKRWLESMFTYGDVCPDSEILIDDRDVYINMPPKRSYKVRICKPEYIKDLEHKSEILKGLLSAVEQTKMGNGRNNSTTYPFIWKPR
jgi:hypothetical protein